MNLQCLCKLHRIIPHRNLLVLVHDEDLTTIAKVITADLTSVIASPIIIPKNHWLHRAVPPQAFGGGECPAKGFVHSNSICHPHSANVFL